MVKIIKVNWLSKEALEAEVTVSDGRFELKCFSQPFNYAFNDFIETPLYCYDACNIEKAQNSDAKVQKLQDSFDYMITGKLISKNDSSIEVGNIILKIERSDLPGDIKEGNYVSFISKRIDLY